MLFWHHDIDSFHVLIVFKMMMSLSLLYFVHFLEFLTIIEIGIINDLKLHTKFQLNILFCYQDIGNIMLSLSLNDDVINFDLFCQLIRSLLP